MNISCWYTALVISNKAEICLWFPMFYTSWILCYVFYTRTTWYDVTLYGMVFQLKSIWDHVITNKHSLVQAFAQYVIFMILGDEKSQDPRVSLIVSFHACFFDCMFLLRYSLWLFPFHIVEQWHDASAMSTKQSCDHLILYFFQG